MPIFTIQQHSTIAKKKNMWNMNVQPVENTTTLPQDQTDQDSSSINLTVPRNSVDYSDLPPVHPIREIKNTRH